MVTRRRSHTNSDELEVEMKQDSVCQEVQSVRFQATGHTCNFLGLDEVEEGRGKRERMVKAEGNPGARKGGRRASYPPAPAGEMTVAGAATPAPALPPPWTRWNWTTPWQAYRCALTESTGGHG